ncbi:uncharacterized protein TRUGW13939_08799 [Talaromyces rugulosus]|uniref:Uncharacterized protein n=1 Tax=Talaromyces rugulosus TaxID=121627 RepID=A0A7H8R616_TALRU|nr:uncharacterized protein TRUGW13939_08792 [Talaromyces rugulosus]XP_035347821.1 uncharacterized protein TRUGW13939_08799 [Talaromyces rugulosus]QKX61640.1 hypothetical protein TRUGW13939_08792 [Talaromyces rugulosus]QKX61647.1 hypothetical protein TRUGW13939_08799 [Talaromyces rugulosus]
MSSKSHETSSDRRANLASLDYKIRNAIGWFFSGFQHLSTVLAENTGLDVTSDNSSDTDFSRPVSTDNSFMLEANIAAPHVKTISSGLDGGETPGKRDILLERSVPNEEQCFHLPRLRKPLISTINCKRCRSCPLLQIVRPRLWVQQKRG